MSNFVQELPVDPEEGCLVWLSLGKEGFWSEQLFKDGRWCEVGGMAVPYIPSEFKKLIPLLRVASERSMTLEKLGMFPMGSPEVKSS
jgi:hypothetical protein